MKRRSLTVAVLLTIVAMVGCQNKDKATENQALPVEFTCESIQSRLNESGDKWVAGDKIGAFMVQEGATALSDENLNVPYIAQNGGSSSTKFIPEDTENAIDYLENANMDFFAYYPYDPAQIGSTITVDCKDQTQADFMWATTTGKKRGDIIALPFNHMMSQLELVITHKESVESLSGLSCEIQGVMSKGEYEVTTGKLAEGTSLSGDQEPIKLPTQNFVIDKEAENGYSPSPNESADMVVAKIIIHPQTLAQEAPVAILFAGRQFYLTIPANKEFKAGHLHRYQIVVGNDTANFKGESTIEDWGAPIEGEDLNGFYNE